MDRRQTSPDGIRRRGFVAAGLAAAVSTPLRAQGGSSGTGADVLARIRDAAMASDWAYDRLADLADLIGPRLSGSAGARAAVAQLSAVLGGAGLAVRLQPVRVPHWVRGEERAELVAYAGRPEGVTQRLVVTALGGSSATPAAGLVAPVAIVRSFEEIDARAAELAGRIVLFSAPFEQHLADNGLARIAYAQAVLPRVRGPARLARAGAVAALVRSATGARHRTVHTGATVWPIDARPIPAAALSVEDTLLVERLAARGPLSMRLVLTPETKPDAEGNNVIAELAGRELPGQVVVLGAHLDSWDLGTGAMDDGIGIAATTGAVALLKRLELVPRRSVRVVAFANEENGSRGSLAYFQSVREGVAATHVAAIESDFGVGRPLGLFAPVDAATGRALQPVLDALRPIGAGALDRRDGGIGADLAPLQAAGVPSFAPLVDTRRYFDFHHAPADTLDKVDPDALRRLVAVLAVLAWFLAERDGPT